MALKTIAYTKKGKINKSDNSNAYLVKKEAEEVPILGYGDSSHDWTTIEEKGVIAVFEAVGNGDGNLQTAYVAAKELGVSYAWDDFVERNLRDVNSRLFGQLMAAVVYIDNTNVVTALNVGNVMVMLLRDGNTEEVCRINKYIMGDSVKLKCRTSFRMLRNGDVLLVLNSGMFEVLYDDILKAAKFECAKEKVEYLNRKLKVHEQMYAYMNDSTIVMVYEG